MIANVLPSHETMPEWMNSNWSAADGLRMWVCGSPLLIVGLRRVGDVPQLAVARAGADRELLRP